MKLCLSSAFCELFSRNNLFHNRRYGNVIRLCSTVSQLMNFTPDEPLERQLDEIELIRAAYTDSEVIINYNDEGSEVVLKVICSKSFSTYVQVWIPERYPQKSLRFSVNSTELNLSAQAEWMNLIQSFLDQRERLHCCFELVQYLFGSYNDAISAAQNGECIICTEPNNCMISGHDLLMQVLIYFHHIKSTFKKKEIIENAVKLQIGGAWKEGFPGIVIAEGTSVNVKEYIRILQRLRWQHMVVRGERVVDITPGKSIDEMRQLPRDLSEMRNMSELGRLCTEAGLHDLFMTMMKGIIL